MRGLKTTRRDPADHLVSREAKLAYLEAVLEDGDPDLIAAAFSDVTRATARAASFYLSSGR